MTSSFLTSERKKKEMIRITSYRHSKIESDGLADSDEQLKQKHMMQTS